MASNWVGFGGLERVNGLLGIPGGVKVFAILALGYAAQAAGKGKNVLFLVRRGDNSIFLALKPSND